MADSFALLMTVYAGDRPDHLRTAFTSAVMEQTRRPAQVVLVQDGPISPELSACLEELRAQSPVEVTFLALERNNGLGPALDAGLALSRHDVVARMDADDIAFPHRFETQMALIEQGADLVGAGLVEFGRDLDDVVGHRTPPVDPEAIARYARMHDPFNHPTVVYRRSAVLAAGGYGDVPLMEDYWLFVRMIAGGARVANVAEPLVYYRVGEGAYERRGGLRLLRSELRLQAELLRHGFTSRPQYIRNVVIRGGYRLVPTWLRRPVYQRVVAPYGARLNATVPVDGVVIIPSQPTGAAVPTPPAQPAGVPTPLAQPAAVPTSPAQPAAVPTSQAQHAPVDLAGRKDASER
jgi:glycosyltransferase involved in cell wall biosynthesis